MSKRLYLPAVLLFPRSCVCHAFCSLCRCCALFAPVELHLFLPVVSRISLIVRQSFMYVLRCTSLRLYVASSCLVHAWCVSLLRVYSVALHRFRWSPCTFVFGLLPCASFASVHRPVFRFVGSLVDFAYDCVHLSQLIRCRSLSCYKIYINIISVQLIQKNFQFSESVRRNPPCFFVKKRYDEHHCWS